MQALVKDRDGVGMHRQINGNALHLMQNNETVVDELELFITTRILMKCL